MGPGSARDRAGIGPADEDDRENIRRLDVFRRIGENSTRIGGAIPDR